MRHTTILCTALMCAMVAPCLAGPLVAMDAIGRPAKNLTVNGDFEDYARPAAPGWSAGKTFWAQSGEGAHRGKYSLVARGNEAYAGRISQKVAIAVGETYTLSAWLKSDALSTMGTGDNTPGVKVIDAGWYWAASIAPADATSDWKRYSVTFEAPPSRHYDEQFFSVSVFIPRGESGTLWVDDIQVERGAQATAFTSKAVPQMLAAAERLNAAGALLESIPLALARMAPKEDTPVELSRQVTQLQTTAGEAARGVLQFESLTEEEWRRGRSLAEEAPRKARELAWQVWWTNPWERYGRRQAPRGIGQPKPATLRLAINDYAPLALMVTNLGDAVLDVRARLRVEGRPEWSVRGPQWATLRQARMVTPVQEPGGEYPTVLAPLDDTRTISVGSAETTQLWIDVSTYGLAPGTLQATLELVPQQDLEPRQIPITLHVARCTLPQRCPADVFCWGLNPLEGLGEKPDMPQEQINAIQDPWLADMARHGINRLLHTSQCFTPRFADNDTLAAPIDFTWHDKLLASKRRYVDKFIGGYSVAWYHMPRVPDAKFERRFGAMMKAWTDHLLELGITPDDMMFELLDEPSGQKQKVFQVARDVLARVAPQWKAMAAVSVSTAKGLRPLSEMMDLMVVSPLLKPDADEAMRAGGRQVWTYRCSGTLNTLEPYAYYRLLPWHTWSKGYSGFGFYWTMSKMLSPRDNRYSPFYVGATGPVPSRGWQAFWRGTRDWAYLSALRDAVAAAGKRGEASVVEKARRVLEQAVQEVTASPQDAALADAWREKILDVLVDLSDGGR